MARRLNRLFEELRTSVPPPSDREEEKRRQELFLKATNGILLRAFAYLDEHHPAVARALVVAGREYTEATLRGDSADFIVRIKAAKDGPDFLMHPGVLAAHQVVLQRLRENWHRQASSSTHHLKTHYVSKKGRYGSAQRSAARKRALIAAGRLETVRRLLEELFDRLDREMPEVGESTLKRWLTLYPTPANLSYKVVGFSIGKSPRQVQTLLTRARKYMKDAEEHHKILDLWGWARGGGDQSTPPGKG